MKKLTIISSVILSSLLILTGCSSNSSKKSNVTSKVKVVKQSSSKEKQKSVTKKKSGVLWNSDKDSRLEDFMKQWGEAMDQTYTKYDGINNIQTASGMNYPQDFGSATVDGHDVSMAWNKKGTGKNDYNVVAIYNYNNSSSSSITYAFTLADGEPIVLVNEDSGNNWSETKNKSLKENFVNIFDGKATHVEKPAASSSSVKNSTKGTEDMGEGRGGYVTTPEAMRGTWYSKDENGITKLVISEHEITYVNPDGQGGRITLYKKTISTPDNVSQDEVKAKMEWGDARYTNMNGLQYINVLGWYQSAGAGAYYAAHTEEINGNRVPIIVEGGGAEAWTYAIYYPSEDLANQQVNTKYEDLHYQ